jgi:Rod binding domain-containing protein
VQPPDPVTSLTSGSIAAPRMAPAASDAKLRETAKQFEGVFMAEMLRLARPPSHAAGPFAAGHGEKSWQVFMDQALGEAAAAKGDAGLRVQIEKALRTAQGHRGNGAKQ